MDDVTHIGNGRAYLFQTTRNIVLEQVRRSKITRIDNVTDMGSLGIVDERHRWTEWCQVSGSCSAWRS